MAPNIYDIWFSSVTGVSLKAKVTLLSEYGTAEAAFRSAPGSFYQVNGLSKSAAAGFEKRDIARADEIIAACAAQDIRIITMDSPEYPERLRNIYCPPTALYTKGNLPPVDDTPVIAVIGTRKASKYGLRMGRKLAYQISACGGTVMSGLTSGVDASAAEGAIQANRPCIAVLGTAHDKENGSLSKAVLSNGGVLISEYPPGTEQERGFFRARNRIGAGVSVGVVVVEAPEKSGTRLFVNDAVEQGKDVFAVPGNADANNSAGTNALIQDGALAVMDGADIMQTYAAMFPAVSCKRNLQPEDEPVTQPVAKTTVKAEEKEIHVRRTPQPTPIPGLETLTENQRSIVQVLENSPAVVDEIVTKTGLPVARVLSQLTVLEIKRIIRRDAGKRIYLNY